MSDINTVWYVIVWSGLHHMACHCPLTMSVVGLVTECVGHVGTYSQHWPKVISWLVGRHLGTFVHVFVGR